MNRIYLVAWREFAEALRTKIFWLLLLAVPVLCVLAIGLPTFVAMIRGPASYAVIDQSGWLLADVERLADKEDLELVLTESLQAYRRAPDRHLPDEVRRSTVALNRAIDSVSPPKRNAVPTALHREIAQAELVDAYATRAARVSHADLDALHRLLPSDAASALAKSAQEFGQWWRTLSAGEARSVSPRTARARFVRIPIAVPDTQEPEPEKVLAPILAQLERGELSAAFVVPPTAEVKGAVHVTNNLISTDIKEWFAGLATRAVSNREGRRGGDSLDPAARSDISLAFHDAKLVQGRLTEIDLQERARHFAPLLLVYLLWIVINMSTQSLLTSTMEEKANRTVELVLSSVRPFEFMAGKILGIGAQGLTAVVIWVASLILIVAAVPELGSGFNVDLLPILTDPFYIGSFLGYFVLGYLFYAALIAGIGAAYDNPKDAQAATLPVNVLRFLPIFVIGLNHDPNTLFSRLLSFFPPLTPYMMMSRAASRPGSLEYLGTTAVLLATSVLAMLAAAKIFRLHILLRGNPERPMQLIRRLLSREASS